MIDDSGWLYRTFDDSAHEGGKPKDSRL